jgi:hypothetical protein
LYLVHDSVETHDAATAIAEDTATAGGRGLWAAIKMANIVSLQLVGGQLEE